MSPRSRRHTARPSNTRAEAHRLLGLMLTQARVQFGDAIKSFWFYEGEWCPGCLARPVGTLQVKGEQALAINAFIYRARGVLIGYFLCETCAGYIFREAEKNPHQQTPLHGDIEANLIAAYHQQLSALDA